MYKYTRVITDRREGQKNEQKERAICCVEEHEKVNITCI